MGASVTAGEESRDEAEAAAAPRLGVHVLSEFTFCPRAGLIAMGQERDDRGDDYWLRPNLDFRPAWEEAQRRASELLGNEGISLLDKAARKVGMSQADR